MAGAEVFLVYGGTGFLGPRVIALLEKGGHRYVLGKARIQNREAVERELDEVKPTHVMNVGMFFLPGGRSAIGCLSFFFLKRGSLGDQMLIGVKQTKKVGFC